MVLTEVNGPCSVPALDVLPLEQSSQRFPLAGHPRAGQLNFFLSEDPGHQKGKVNIHDR